MMTKEVEWAVSIYYVVYGIFLFSFDSFETGNYLNEIFHAQPLGQVKVHFQGHLLERFFFLSFVK